MAKVFFADMRASHKENLFDKISRLLTLSGLDKAVTADDLTAVKIHFGEKGNSAFIRPIFARRVVDEVKKLGARPFLTDSSPLPRRTQGSGLGPLLRHRERLRLCLRRRTADHQRRPAGGDRNGGGG